MSSSEVVVAVKELIEGLLLAVILIVEILDVIDLTRSVLNLKKVGVHGGVSGTNVVWHGMGGSTTASVPLGEPSQGP